MRKHRGVGEISGPLARREAKRMPENDSRVIDQRLVRAVAHPLRVEILETLVEGGEMSPSQIAKQLGCQIGNVSYHVNVLKDCGVIELVGTRQRRGALEHFFRPVTTAPSFIELAKSTFS
jgi:DNA-binding transcriptional ArsR family regulator